VCVRARACTCVQAYKRVALSVVAHVTCVCGCVRVATGLVQPPNYCASLPQPLLSQPCFNKPCGANGWRVGPWSDCSTPCGAGTAVREVSCVSVLVYEPVSGRCPFPRFVVRKTVVIGGSSG
jgi:hypothetical protein